MSDMIQKQQRTHIDNETFVKAWMDSFKANETIETMAEKVGLKPASAKLKASGLNKKFKQAGMNVKLPDLHNSATVKKVDLKDLAKLIALDNLEQLS